MGIWVNHGPMDGATLSTMKGRDKMRESKGRVLKKKSKIPLMEGNYQRGLTQQLWAKQNASTGCGMQRGVEEWVFIMLG